MRNLVLPLAAVTLLTLSALGTGTPIAAPSNAGAPLPDDVIVVGEPILAAPEVAGAVADTACSDTTYARKPWHLAGTYSWLYNGARAPASVGGTALTSIRTATQNLVRGTNRCAIAVTSPVSQAYAGATTSAVAQIGATGTCTGNDGRSVTSWGTLSSGYLGYTCVYYRSNGVVLASDMLLSNSHSWFTTRPLICLGSYDLESVVVHERGHTLGLEHVDQFLHPAQIMTPRISSCDTTKRLLAAGDVAGLRAVTSQP
ncbi:matrixin family metalloprotease [Amycolatopsis sp. NPDC051128]|uniref:matrixin family metalloprotease n=1 Tax=Amycolatopsis sp. NPDC051128 TaxID=3155412 RepID=UPI003416A395